MVDIHSQQHAAPANHTRFPRTGLLIAGLIWAIIGAAPEVSHAQPDRSPGGFDNNVEHPLLTNHVQVTTPDRFLRAGEAYFSPDGARIVFQAIPVPAEGEPPRQHYQMYVADLVRNERGLVTGIDSVRTLASPGSANTCGWFTPDGQSIIFGSTVSPPAEPDAPGYQRSGSRYAWQFPSNMDIVRVPIPGLNESPSNENHERFERLVERDGYDAECSISPDGRFLLYAHADPPEDGAPPDADIWIRDLQTGSDHPIVVAKGYDGGPFFSPDARWICYRSDRKGDDRLQIYVAELEFDSEGVPVGIKRELQLTDDAHVNWAPYFHPSGRFLVYTTSLVGHDNYEIVSVRLPRDDAPATSTPDEPDRRRLTFAPGFDGLPAFSRDGSLMMWPSQRAGHASPGGSSQIWIARAAPASRSDRIGPDAPARWTGSLSGRQAIALARDHLAAIGLNPERRYRANRSGAAWTIEAFDLGDTQTLRIDPIGRVEPVSTAGN